MLLLIHNVNTCIMNKILYTLTFIVFPNFIRDPAKTTCTAGGQCNMTCLSMGVPAPNVIWFQNGYRVTVTSYISFNSLLTYSQTLSSFLISFVTLNHSGNYHCLASNFLKTNENATSNNATLEVHCKLM